MLRTIKNQKGMTLVEIILATAILGIILVAVLSLFNFSFSNIFVSGFRTDNVLQIETIADDLTSKNNAFTFDDDRTSADNSYKQSVGNYLSSKGYNQVMIESDLTTMVAGKDINFFVESATIEGVYGYRVTFLKFFKSGTQSIRLTTFIGIGS